MPQRVDHASWNFPLTTWNTRFIFSHKNSEMQPMIFSTNQPFSKNREFVTWRIKFSKNRLAILPKFFKAKNSLLGPNNQQKILLKKLRDIGLKIKEKNLWKMFLQFWLENTLNTLFPELFSYGVLEYFSKRNHFKVYVRLRLSQWHINKNLIK